MDFGMLPPEINSGRMYTGPGAGSMLGAAAAWNELAAQLHSAAASYSSAISGLTAGWQGPSSAMMAAAVAPYTAWMGATATQAEQAATRARAAAAAYETAFAATVPPQIVAANRALLMSLIATNFLGQNTAAIAATESHYAEMWAQDAAAMFGYAGSSAAASQLTPFTKPPDTTNPAGPAGQAAAVAQASGTAAGMHAQTLSPLASPIAGLAESVATSATPADPPSLASILSSLTGPFSPLALSGFGLSGYLLSTEPYGLASVGSSVAGLSQKVSALPSAASGGLLDGGLGSGSRLVGSTVGVSAGTGQADVVGRLSVPPGWASAAPAIKPVAVVLPDTNASAVAAAVSGDSQGSVFSSMALSTLAGRAMVDTGGSASRPIGVGGGAYSGPAPAASIIVILPDE
jgi:PPE-repeat protein